MRKIIYVILMAVVVGTSTLAQATVKAYHNDDWEAFVAATTNATTITFNDMAISIEPVTSISTQGVTFSSSRLCVLPGGFYDTYSIPIPTNYLNNSFGDKNLIITFSNPIFGFAMNYGALIPASTLGMSGTFSFAGMSEDFVLPGLLSFDNNSSGLSLIGFTSDTSFNQIEINDRTTSLVIDNFIYTTNPAVPVPAAIWLLGSGLLGFLGGKRKFRK